MDRKDWLTMLLVASEKRRDKKKANELLAKLAELKRTQIAKRERFVKNLTEIT